MTIKERITACRLVQMVEVQGRYAKQIGLICSIKSTHLNTSQAYSTAGNFLEILWDKGN